jgi:3-oxoacyl-[acyl-carrier protein] reductase
VHAYSTSTPLGGLDAAEIDRHLIVNIRATLLLAEAYAATFTAGSATPGSATPGSDTPGSATPGSDALGSDTPGSDTPGSGAAGPGGRLVLFSSGQRLGPMPGELAYAASKAGVENLTRQLSPLLTPRGITVNCVNPGPTDTGYATESELAAMARLFPSGRWGTPDDAARLVEWLCSIDAGWLTGQVIDSEGGFNRYV